MAATFTNRVAAVFAIIIAPFLGGAAGIAIAFYIGGAASEWHPDVGGAFGIGVSSIILGIAGLCLGLWGAYRLYSRVFEPGMRS